MINRNFNEIYKEIYTNGYKELEQYKKKNLIGALITIIMFAFLYMAFSQKSFSLIFIFLALFVGSLLYTSNARGRYKEAFKELVIHRLVYLYNPELQYSAIMGVTKNEYTESFFDNFFNKFHSEDGIKGTLLNKYNFKMSEVTTSSVETKTNANGRTEQVEHIVFRGLFGIVDIKDIMILKMDITSDNLLNKYNKSRIEVDSNEFEDKYDLFSLDKVRTMEIFTSDLIEEFNKFEKETGAIMQIKVVPNKLYFRVKISDNFELPFLKSSLDYNSLYNNFKMIDYPLTLITKILKNAENTKK